MEVISSIYCRVKFEKVIFPIAMVSSSAWLPRGWANSARYTSCNLFGKDRGYVYYWDKDSVKKCSKAINDLYAKTK